MVGIVVSSVDACMFVQREYREATTGVDAESCEEFLRVEMEASQRQYRLQELSSVRLSDKSVSRRKQ